MKIQYLTWLHEKTGRHEDHIDLPDNVKTVACLINYLEGNKEWCATVFKNRHTVYTAVNDEIKPPEFRIENSDNVSFFSAIVGG